jgi:hypothetical protein
MLRYRVLLPVILLAPLGIRAQTDTTVVQAADTVAVEASDSLWYNKTPQPLTLHPRHIPGQVADSLRQLDDFWYVSVGKDKPEPVKPPDTHENWWFRFVKWLIELFQKPWMVFLGWTLLAGALVAAIVYIIQSVTGVRWFGRKNPALNGDEAGNTAAAPDDPALALQKALAAGDYREAERCLYLVTLRRLGERGLLRLLQEKTNREYLRELRGHALYDAFARLTRHYDYTWYGGFAPSPAAFEGLRAEYDQFQNRLDTL